MPKGSRCFGSHATRIAINGSFSCRELRARFGHREVPQYESAVVERLEDDQVISVCANPYRIAQVWPHHVVMRSLSNLFAVLPHLANERDSASRIVECDVVADLLQVDLGLWREVRAFTSRVLDHFGVLAFQTFKYLGGGFRFAAAATPFDFADQMQRRQLFMGYLGAMQQQQMQLRQQQAQQLQQQFAPKPTYQTVPQSEAAPIALRTDRATLFD